jgi:hypothetical protein
MALIPDVNNPDWIAEDIREIREEQQHRAMDRRRRAV